MPNSARPAGAASKARLQRSAQRSDSCMARSISAALGRQPHAFVELHGDIGAEQDLHFDGALRRQLDHGAVEMRAEGDARLRHFAQGCKRHHLIAAGIGEDRIAASA